MNTQLIHRTFQDNSLSVHRADDWIFIQSGSLEFSVDKSSLNITRLFDPAWIEGLNDGSDTVNLFIDSPGPHFISRVVLTITRLRLIEFKHFIIDIVESKGNYERY